MLGLTSAELVMQALKDDYFGDGATQEGSPPKQSL